MKMIKQTLGLNVEDRKYYLKLIIEAILIGLFSGFVVSIYRLGLDNSEKLLFSTLKYIQGDFMLTIAWFVILAIMGLITALLMKWDPDSTGSGIPQVMGEVKGYFDVTWWKTLIAKFIGGTLTALGGLSLGREGPSVQLGAMAAKGVSKHLPNSKTDEKRLLVCGSGAGLSATFSAPLAGFIFTLEEINKGFDRSIVIVGLISALVADFVSKIFFGQSPIFPFTSVNLPLKYFYLLIILGILIGLLGYIYNVGMIKASQLWDKLSFLPIEVKFIIVFLVTGIVGLFLPEVLGGGYSMMSLIQLSLPPLSVLIVLLIGKYLLLIFCFGSSAPGGIFYPVLVIGAYIGAIFSAIVIPIFGLNPLIAYKFIMISMAAMFASSVRTPITAVVLISEMTGVTNSLAAMIAVVVLAYIIPTVLGNEPIYETLLMRLLKKNKGIDFDKTKSVLEEYVVPMDCTLIGQKIWELPIPKSAMVVSVVRSGNTLIPNENLELKYADELFIIMNQNTYAEDNQKIEQLIYNNQKEEKKKNKFTITEKKNKLKFKSFNNYFISYEGENMRIAVASSNGEDLDLHFGKAHSLYVYEYDEEHDEINFIDKRTVEIESDTKHQNPKIIKALEDCEVAICQQFGPKAQIHAEDAGLKLVKDEGKVDEVLRKYIDHVNFMKNIKI